MDIARRLLLVIGTCGALAVTASCGSATSAHPLAESWYTSGTVLGITATVIAGVAGVWATIQTADIRKELAYKVLPITTSPEVHRSLVEIHMVNRGRRDIPTSAFDQGRPLHLDVAATILKILRYESIPDGFTAPRIQIVDTAIDLGPDLIKRRQAVIIQLLVDGEDPQVTIPKPPFVDIRVREYPSSWRDSIDLIAMRPHWARAAWGETVGLATLGALMVTLSASSR